MSTYRVQLHPGKINDLYSVTDENGNLMRDPEDRMVYYAYSTGEIPQAIRNHGAAFTKRSISEHDADSYKEVGTILFTDGKPVFIADL